VISKFLINQKFWIQIIGLVFLFYLGIETIIKKNIDIEFKSVTDKGLLKDYFSTFSRAYNNR
jgi:cbb3-type cytochrome oxidase subunit 1